ncbi:MAG: DsbA family protein [Acidobacteria bacterium]|nr:DsbA family protein [Acidobacteriota bacterium]
MRFLFLCFLALGLMAQGKKKPSKPVAVEQPKRDLAKIEAYLRHLNLWTPEIKFEVVDTQPSSMLPGFDEMTIKASLGERFAEQKILISADGKTIVKGEVLDTSANPFIKDIALIRNVGQPSMGTVGAPVVLSVYTDYQCPYCREQAKTLRANLMKTFPKEVRLFIHDFPLEQIHPWARPAAIAGRCIYLQGEENYWKYHDWVFDQQQALGAETFRGMLMSWAPANGIDSLQLTRCYDNKETDGEVTQDLAGAKKLGINSTPTLYVNGRKLAGSVSWEQLKSIIDVEVKYQATAKNAGDTACCSVSLTTPGVK